MVLLLSATIKIIIPLSNSSGAKNYQHTTIVFCFLHLRFAEKCMIVEAANIYLAKIFFWELHEKVFILKLFLIRATWLRSHSWKNSKQLQTKSLKTSQMQKHTLLLHLFQGPSPPPCPTQSFGQTKHWPFWPRGHTNLSWNTHSSARIDTPDIMWEIWLPLKFCYFIINLNCSCSPLSFSIHHLCCFWHICQYYSSLRLWPNFLWCNMRKNCADGNWGGLGHKYFQHLKQNKSLLCFNPWRKLTKTIYGENAFALKAHGSRNSSLGFKLSKGIIFGNCSWLYIMDIYFHIAIHLVSALCSWGIPLHKEILIFVSLFDEGPS